MDSIEIEHKYDDVQVVETPDEANLIFDSVEEQFYRFLSWTDVHDAYHTQLKSNTTVTLRKYLHPTNRYYFVQSMSFQQKE